MKKEVKLNLSDKLLQKLKKKPAPNLKKQSSLTLNENLAIIDEEEKF